MSEEIFTPVDAHLKMSNMSKQKYCVLPDQRLIKLSTTLGGHTILITEKPEYIPAVFEQDALGKGAVTEMMLNRIKESLGDDESPDTPTPTTLPSSTPGMETSVRFEKIKAALLPILLAGKPEDFTTQGIPQVGSAASGKGLGGACGFDVTASERDAAYEIVKDHPDVLALK